MSVTSQQVSKPATGKPVRPAQGVKVQVRGFAGNHMLMRKQGASETVVRQADERPQRVRSEGKEGYLQRKCACGTSGKGGECEECKKPNEGMLQRAMQMKLAVNEASDRYEQEADRVANQVLAAPTNSSVSCAPPRIQRYTGQATGQAETAPDSVGRVLASPGSPLGPALRQDMEQRFGHDFGRVRVHVGAAAERSAGEVNAHAYTVGANIVFGRGQFLPTTHEGRRLIAHELTHVVQQSGETANRFRLGDGQVGFSSLSSSQRKQLSKVSAPQFSPVQPFRIQRKKRSEKNLSVVRIVAFEGQKSGEAHLSDGSIEPVTLSINSLEPGTYIYELDFSQTYNYRLAYSEVRSGAIRWYPKSIFEGEFQRADKVTVTIVPGDRSTLSAQIEALPKPIKNFLTTDKEKGPVSIADMESVANAGFILELAGVSEEELLLREHLQAEAEDFGQTLGDSQDPAAWAVKFVQERQEAGVKALTNRQELMDLIRQVENIRDEPNDPSRRNIKDTAEGVFTEDTIGSILIHHNIYYHMLTDRFEVELSAITMSFLSQAQVALLRIEKMYLANQNIGAEKDRLRQVIEKIRPAVTRLDEATHKLPDPIVRMVIGEDDPRLKKADAEVSKKNEELQEQSKAAGLGAAGWQTFDLDVIRGTDIETSRNTLRQFVYSSRSKLRSAEQKAQSIKTLYGADRMIELTKATLGIKPGSVMNDVIRARVRAQTQDHSFWSAIWDIVTFALMFVPGNIGVALRVGAGVINATKAMDEYAEGVSLHEVGFKSQAPSSLGVFLAVGGSLIDAQQMAKGVFQVIDTEASLAAKAAVKGASAQSTVGREAGETVVKSADDIAEQQIVRAEVGETTVKSADDVAEQQIVKTEAAEAKVVTQGEPAAIKSTEVGPDPRGVPHHQDPTLIGIRGEARDLAMVRQEETALLKRKAALEKETLDTGHTIDRLEDQLDQIRGKASKDRVANIEKQLERARDIEKAEADRLLKIEQDLATIQDEIRNIEKTLPKASPPTTPPRKTTGELNVPDQPTRYKGGRIHSWFEDVYVGTSQARFRPNVEALLQAEPQGPLSKALLRNNEIAPANVGDAAFWKAHPEIFDAGHVRSANVGDKDVLVVMSKWRNEAKYSADLERTGDILLDEAYVIQGIAVDRGTAWELVEKKLLDKAVVDGAPVIKLAR